MAQVPSCLLVLVIGVATIVSCMCVRVEEGTEVGFYSKTCPKAEDIVRSTVEDHVKADLGLAPGLLRLHFHDCFVQGCDGSVLISGSSAERSAPPNLGLRGFEVIDDAKTKVEAESPELFHANGPSWAVATGRRDGLISSSSEVTSNLPSPLESVSVQKQKFADKGLTTEDLVTLTHRQFIRYRFYNFTSTGNADPTINSANLPQLQSICPVDGDGTKAVALDKGSETNFDASIFKNIRDGNGVLEWDQRLCSDESTKMYVQRYAGSIRGLLGFRFDVAFAKALQKMSNIGVKTGTQGEVRKVCSAFNS
eukprot:PITA_23886